MMDKHPDLSTLRRFLNRRLSLEEVLELSWHFARCEPCRDRLERLSPRAADLVARLLPGLEQEGPLLSPGDYEAVFDRVRRRIETRVATFSDDLRRGKVLAAELARLPDERRRRRVRSDPHCASRGLAEEFLRQARERWAADPDAAEEEARLALEVIQRLDPDVFGGASLNDLQARAWAYLANVQRIRSDLRSVEESFARAESYLEQGSGDPMARAEILDLEASYARAQRRFDDALNLLNQVSAAYAKAGDEHLVGRTLVSKAAVHGYAGRPDRSVPLLRKALERIDARREPRVHLAALQQLVLFLNELGRRHEALALLPEARRTAATVGTQHDRLRIRWVEGLLAAQGEELEEAEAALVEVQEGFISEGIGYDAALASLDLAALYLRQGRTAETRDLAATMLPLFQSRDIHREALAALMVFHRAVEIEKATVGMVRDIAQYLRQAQVNAAGRYEEPS